MTSEEFYSVLMMHIWDNLDVTRVADKGKHVLDG